MSFTASVANPLLLLLGSAIITSTSATTVSSSPSSTKNRFTSPTGGHPSSRFLSRTINVIFAHPDARKLGSRTPPPKSKAQNKSSHESMDPSSIHGTGQHAVCSREPDQSDHQQD
eukprot:CAMPEP_0113970312 /NCGR_PEP_ID=MMETSP0011_2-20120614/11060_1 /TAXON_ID=101924 /ORGANISM="Rhodosorus marinus" /LENGTH=114 /DNA_ID=CAMNT_0000984581 /DNA_START=278 /DNA_END=620 /DNA_ORIENTATION=+ /assembly_acc=CAM_ASM_000156